MHILSFPSKNVHPFFISSFIENVHPTFHIPSFFDPYYFLVVLEETLALFQMNFNKGTSTVVCIF